MSGRRRKIDAENFAEAAFGTGAQFTSPRKSLQTDICEERTNKKAYSEMINEEAPELPPRYELVDNKRLRWYMLVILFLVS